MKKLEKILKSINENTDIDLRTNKRRKRDVIDVKTIFCHIARKKTKYTCYEIGKFIGIDHATVLHHCKKFNDLIGVDKDFKSLYDRIYFDIDRIYFDIDFIDDERDLREYACRHLLQYRHYKTKLSNLNKAC
jgi:hypothetical protein